MLKRGCPGDPKNPVRFQYSTSPDDVLGGQYERKIDLKGGEPYAWTCPPAQVDSGDLRTQPLLPNGSAETTKGEAVNFVRGFSAAPLGKASFSGDTRSNYTSNVMVSVRVGSTGGVYCGDDNAPQRAKRLQVIGL